MGIFFCQSSQNLRRRCAKGSARECCLTRGCSWYDALANLFQILLRLRLV
eukprot:COSAG05_NODE_12590_length_462_cov_0.950413_1_plen_49_part_10